MTTLKEKILEILHKQDYHTTALVIKQIVSLFEGYYEKEFVEWIGDNGVEKFHDDEQPVWYVYARNETNPCKILNSVDELYTYWQKEVKK